MTVAGRCANMLGTLFFDESDSNSVVRILHQQPDLRSTLPSHTQGTDALKINSFRGSGSVHLPEILATVHWWVDGTAPLVHLLAVNDTVSARSACSAQTRLMSVEMPVPSSQYVLTCGVARCADGGGFNAITVAWMTSSLEMGYLRVSLQRESDQASTLTMTPLGRLVKGFPLQLNEGVGGASDSSQGCTGCFSACVVAEVPADDQLIAALYVVTNGRRVWRMQLGVDGMVSQSTMDDSKNGATTGFPPAAWFHTRLDSDGPNIQSMERYSGAGGKSGWLSRLLNTSTETGGGKRRYLSVSAVQRTPLVAILYSNGIVEFYDSSLSPVQYLPSCCLFLGDEQPDGFAMQWSTLDVVGGDVNILTCVTTTAGRRCFWSVIPQVPHSAERRVALRSSHELTPPTASAVPIGCACSTTGTLLLLWNIVTEDMAPVFNTHSLASIFHASQEVSGFLQVISATCASDGELQWRSIDTFLCRGASLYAAMSQEGVFFVVEKHLDHHRVHVVQGSAAPPLVSIAEGVLVNSRETFTTAAACVKERGLHLVPTVEQVTCAAGNEDHHLDATFTAFWEGADMIRHGQTGSALFGELLQSVVSGVSSAAELRPFLRLLSEAYMCGFQSSATVSCDTMRAAMKYACDRRRPPSPSETRPPFCNYSRHFVLHCVSRDLRARIVFLTCSFLGFLGANPNAAVSSVSFEAVSALSFLAAAYHLVCAAGPELVCIASNPGGALVNDIVGGLLFNSEECTRELFAVQVANRLLRCDNVRCGKAATVWAASLARSLPIMQHYALLFDMDLGRTAQSTLTEARCLAVVQALAAHPADELAHLLVEEGILVTDAMCVTGFSTIRLSEVRAFVVAEPTVAPKLYAVGVLRRLTPSGSLDLQISASVVRRYYLTGLHEVLLVVSSRVAGGGNYSSLLPALQELYLDVLVCLSQASVADAQHASAMRYLEDAYQLAQQLRVYPTYSALFSSIVEHMISSACSSQAQMNNLVTLSNHFVHLQDLLVNKWYAAIARMPTKSASEKTETLRFRAVAGLYRYLMSRHAYAQCGSIMADLASLLRCSPLRRDGDMRITVAELASMALHAVELIHPAPPEPFVEASRAIEDEQQLQPGLSASVSWPSMMAGHIQGAVVHGMQGHLDRSGERWLTAMDLSWLRRWVYQAHCERKLWLHGSSFECTDLWIRGAPQQAYDLGVKRLVEALMTHRLWEDAYRFARLAGYDECRVLEEYALDLLRRVPCADGETGGYDDEQLDEWHTLISFCAESSTLENGYMGYRRAVRAALTRNYAGTLPALMEAHRDLDAYSAMTTLLEVFEASRKGFVPSPSNEDEEGAAPQMLSSGTTERARVWMPVVDAAQIAMDVLQGGKAPITAGVLDPLARYVKELLASPADLDSLSMTNARKVSEQFLQLLEAP